MYSAQLDGLGARTRTGETKVEAMYPPAPLGLATARLVSDMPREAGIPAVDGRGHELCGEIRTWYLYRPYSVDITDC